jgi:hypothetical protein
MVTKEAITQQKLNLLISRTPSEPIITTPPILPEVLSPTIKHKVRPATPPDFDGDRTKGLAFLNSCQTYIRLCSEDFQSEQIQIVWAMSYMKTGRAEKWAARVFRWEQDPANQGKTRFSSWANFSVEFKAEFCPSHTDSAAINCLESTSYFQKSRSVDEYLDEFQDLISDAGYSDPKTVVVKFRRGLNLEIQNQVATMASGRPSDTDPDSWYSLARTVDQNRATNEAFRSSYSRSHVSPLPRQSGFIPLRPPISTSHAHITPTPGNPIPMDIGAGRNKERLPLTCYSCGKPGHKRGDPTCPLKYDVRAMNAEELQTYLEDALAKLDAVPSEPQVVTKESEREVEQEDFCTGIE